MKNIRAISTCLFLIILFTHCGDTPKQTGFDRLVFLDSMEAMRNNLFLEDHLIMNKLADDAYLQYDFSSDTIGLTRSWNACRANVPCALSALNSGSKKFVWIIDRTNQGTAGIFGLGNLKLGKNEKIAVVDYIEYKDTVCAEGAGGKDTAIRLAAGVRLFLRITHINTKYDLNVPSKIAASHEFGLAEVSFSVETIGFKNQKTREILSNLGDKFDVDTYVKVVNAVGDVIKTMNDSMMVNPVRVPSDRK